MSFLGLNRFMVSFDGMSPQTEQTCIMNCCSSHDACCCNEDETKAEDEPERDIQCSGGCNCTSFIQILALGIHFQDFPELYPRTFNHGSYHKEYQFEYLLPHFQPPRMA